MKKFYVTTAIDYVNAEPHIGHAYQKIIADALARWHKLKGEKVRFLTGTDEHGKKIARSAKNQGLKPKEFCDKVSKKFKEAWRELDINYDRFIRTTDNDHKKFVQEFIKKIKKDIHKGEYEGYYCVDCEAYLTERDLVNGECRYHPGKKVEKIKEETYFFKLSKYQKDLLDLYKKQDFILTKERKNEIVNFVKEGLQDLSITRTNFSWGISFPVDKKHVVYVWFDALLNYLSGADGFWPADIHLLGVDNGRFHAVIWPAMLLSAGYKLPKTVFIHGFLTFNGKKISKSLGNSISPIILINKYGSDAIRYFVIRYIPLGQDGDFSEEVLKDRLNNELANDLGNLVSRTLTLVEKNFKKVKKQKQEIKIETKKIEKLIEEFKLNESLNEIWRYVQECNKYINENKIWELKDKQLEIKLYNLLESLRILSILLSPFIPKTSEKINKQLNVKFGLLKDCKFGLVKNYRVKKGEILFRKIK